MPGVAIPYRLPLPRGWPCHIRSAAVHALAIADLAFTRTLRWAADSLNPRLRLQAESERLRREISLLREEILIKDSRMEQVEPHRPPYYPPTARLAILEWSKRAPTALGDRGSIIMIPEDSGQGVSGSSSRSVLRTRSRLGTRSTWGTR